MRRILFTLNGQLDHPQLDTLRNALGLDGIGAATDPIGTILGTRSGRGRLIPTAKLTLLRSDSDSWWLLIDESPKTIGADYPVSPEAWCGLAELAVRAAGLTIGDRRELPSIRPDEDCNQL